MDHCKNERTSNMNGVTPLLIAVKEGNIEIVNMLLEKDSFEEKDNEDRNIFHYADHDTPPKMMTSFMNSP